MRDWCDKCQACQRRKAAHVRPKLPTAHLPVGRPFQRISVDLVEYRSVSPSAGGIECKDALSMMDRVTRFAVLLPVRDKAADTIARAIIERLVNIFGSPETLHSDQGPEFENKVIYQLQRIFGYEKTRTTPYRPQGDSVPERVHSTMHNMLAMHKRDRSKQLGITVAVRPITVAHNTRFSATMHGTPFFLMFGRQPQLPVDIILGIPHVGRTTNTEEFAQNTRDNLQIAFELARRTLTERADKQTGNNSQLKPYPVFKPGQEELVYKPYQDAYGPNPKLLLPWRGPYVVCSQLSPVLGKPIPLPALNYPDEAQPRIES
ncbi:MAG: transposase family protein, partial [Hyphomicrobiales bacterium]